MDEKVAVVVVLPSGNLGARLIDVAREWTQTYLLDEAIWVVSDPQMATRPRFGPPLVQGHLIGRHAAKDVELFSYLADTSFDLVRLVAVRCISPTDSESSANLAREDSGFVNLIREYVDASRALALRDESMHEEQAMTSVNLIVAPTEFGNVPQEGLIEPLWQRNVVASPEDRSRPRAADAFVRDANYARFERFVMAHAATAAGLWATTAGSVYDPGRLSLESARSVSLQRVFVRGVLSEGLAFTSAREALERAVKADSPLLDPNVRAGVESHAPLEGGLSVLPVDRYDEVVQRMVDFSAVMDDGRLLFRRPMPYVSPPAPVKGLFEALGQFSRFYWRAWLALPRWSWNDTVSRWGRVTQKTLFGGDGKTARVDATIDFGRSATFISRIIDRAKEVDLQRERGLREAAAPVPLGREDAESEVWRLLRSMCFSVLDGSDPPVIANRGSLPPSFVTGAAAQGRRFVRIRNWLAQSWGRLRGTGVPAQSVPMVGPTNGPRGATIAFPTQFDEGGRPRVIAQTDVVIPDTKDLWVPSKALVELVGAPVDAPEEAGPFDISAFAKWRDHLQDQSTRFERRLRQSMDLMDRLTSALRLVDDQLSELVRQEQDSEDLSRLSDQQELAELLGEVPIGSPVQAGSESSNAVSLQSDRVSAFRRFFRKIFGRKSAPKPQSADEFAQASRQAPPEVNVESEAADELTIDNAAEESEAPREEEPADLVGAARDRKARLEAKIAEVEQRMREDRDGVDLIELELAELREWLKEREASFAFRLMARLEGERRAVMASINEIVGRINVYAAPGDVEDPQERANFQKDATEKDSNQARTKFVRRTKRALWILGIGGYFLLRTLTSFSPLKSAIIAGILYLVALLIITIIFFRWWAKKLRQIEVALAELVYCANTFPQVRNEQVRLSVIHPQVERRLALLAEALYRPWSFTERAYSVMHPDIDSLPMFVQFAAPSSEGNEAKDGTIINEATTRVLRRGWREAAYKRLLHYANKSAGLPDERFTMEFVDRSSSALDSVLSALADGEAAEDHGTEKLKEYAGFIQEVVIPDVLPVVTDLRTPIREGIDMSGDFLEGEEVRSYEWDQWLSANLGPTTPFATTALGLSGLTSRVGFRVASHAFVPERMERSARSNDIATFAGKSSGTRPIEISVRIDTMSDPLDHPEQAFIFDPGFDDSSGIEHVLEEALHMDDSGL